LAIQWNKRRKWRSKNKPKEPTIRILRNLITFPIWIRRPLTMSSKAVVLDATDEGISQAAKNLLNGGLVALPTETVYGLGANAMIEDSVRNIFKVKGRPLTDPLIVHVPSLKDALELVELEGFEKCLFETLGSAFWPGGLTLIAKQRSFLPLCLSAGTGYVGIRVPNHSLALRLLQEAKCPVAAPSANRFGHVSPTSHLHVLHDLGNHNISILNGDSVETTCKHGIESTVCKIDIENKELVIFRRGAVSEIEIQKVLNNISFKSSPNKREEEESEGIVQNALDWNIRVITKHVPMPENYKHDGSIVKNDNEAQEELKQAQEKETKQSQESQEGQGQVAPGQLITHYAPDVPTFILRCLQKTQEQQDQDHNQQDKHDRFIDQDEDEQSMLDSVVLDFHGNLSWLQDKCLAYQDLSISGDIPSAGRQLFASLRWAECVIGAKRVLIADIESIAKMYSEDSITKEASISQQTNSCIGIEHSASISDRTFRAASGRVMTVLPGKFPPSQL